MRPIIIGAGRGSRLGHLTDQRPKPLVEIMGRPMLDWVVDALGAAGFQAKDIVYICGYRQDDIRAAHPEFTFVENREWESNNILASLLCAREYFSDGFVCSYADIVYRGSIVQDLVASPHDISLGCDTRWRERYTDRAHHPESDAEKLRAEGSRVVEISRRIHSPDAAGEYVGVAKFTAAGARALTDCFDRRKPDFSGTTYREGRSFERAYLIDMLEDMREQGCPIHRVDTPGGYMEIDTLEDYEHAESWWRLFDT